MGAQSNRPSHPALLDLGSTKESPLSWIIVSGFNEFLDENEGRLSDVTLADREFCRQRRRSIAH